jgi:ketosteroid isomerase-like protein
VEVAAMLSWLAGRMIRRDLEKLRAGDYGPLLKRDAEDVRFRFPGDNSWATDLRGKKELEKWLGRFVQVGIQIYADEVIVSGPPWKMAVCIRGTDHLKSPEGETVYENRYVLWGRMAWGRLKEYEAYEDTQASKVFDEYLVRNGLPGAMVESS